MPATATTLATNEGSHRFPSRRGLC
jgi:hypothetical protein